MFTDEVERVVGSALHIGQVDVREPFRVAFRHAEGIEQQHAAAHPAPPPGGDAPQLAPRIDDYGRAPKTPVAGREQVEGDDGALAGAGRGDADGGALQRPADERCSRARTRLAEELFMSQAFEPWVSCTSVLLIKSTVTVGVSLVLSAVAAGRRVELLRSPLPEKGQWASISRMMKPVGSLVNLLG